jgi:Ni/Fe-hydrogenase subunit HybB-like protein
MVHKVIKELRSFPLYVYIIAALAAFGMSIGIYRLVLGLGSTTHLSKAFPWGLWISFDLTTVALSGGAFTMAALVYVFQMHDLHPVTRPTVLFGLLGYGSVLVVLFFDLGRWDRFYHFLIYPNINSALFEVSWCIALYSTILVYEFSPVLLQNSRWKKYSELIKKYTVPVVIAGVTLSTMHQSSLGTLFIIMSPRLHPLWYSLLLPVFFLISSTAAGISLVIFGAILSAGVFHQTLPQRTIEKLGWFIPWILSGYLALKLGELLLTEKLGLLFSSGIYSWLYWGELTVGVLIPILLFSNRRIRLSRSGSFISAGFVLAGIAWNRFNISWFAIKPLDNLTYTPHWMEVAILVGVAASVALIYTVLTHYFPVFEETVQIKPSETTSKVLLPGRKASSPLPGD